MYRLIIGLLLCLVPATIYADPTSVKEWQGIVGVEQDGSFGPATLSASKAKIGLDTSPVPPAKPQAGDMVPSNRGVVFLAANEGAVPGPYLDSVGIWTAYIGHTAAAGSPDPSTMPRGVEPDAKDPNNKPARQAEAYKVVSLFATDLKPYSAAVNKAITVPMTQCEFDAALSFHYNTGAIATATWVKTFNAGDKKTAAEQIMNWKTPSEIIPRRTKEQTLFRDCVYAKDAVTFWDVSTSGQIIWKSLFTASYDDLVAALDAHGRVPH